MNQIAKQIVVFFIYLICQVILFNNFGLWDLAIPFAFLAFLFMLPITINFSAALMVGFGAGLMVDIFSGTPGLHAAACVLIMAIRLFWIDVISNRTAFRGAEETFLKIQPFPWYFAYFFPLILIHHSAYFLLESFGFENFLQTFSRIVLSSVYTFIFVLAISQIFYTKSSGR